MCLEYIRHKISLYDLDYILNKRPAMASTLTVSKMCPDITAGVECCRDVAVTI